MTSLSAMRVFRVPAACLLAFALVATGCGGSSSDAPDASGDASDASDAAAMNVQIEVGDRSPAIEGAQVRFAQPTDGQVVQDTSFDVVVEAQNFESGVQTDTPRAQEIANSSNGQHAHIILDNGPYMANYDVGEPFDVGTLSPGVHTMVVFPSRSYHESVKVDGAHDVVTFYVGEETGEPMIDDDAPTIVYSRPKGTYQGADAETIMLDFYLHNVELSADGYRAKYTIRAADGTDDLASITLTEWTPAFVTGLETGAYVVHLQLLDANGDVVPGPFNDTTREIEVTRDAS